MLAMLDEKWHEKIVADIVAGLRRWPVPAARIGWGLPVGMVASRAAPPGCAGPTRAGGGGIARAWRSGAPGWRRWPPCPADAADRPGCPGLAPADRQTLRPAGSPGRRARQPAPGR